jgi:hypothetical protein
MQKAHQWEIAGEAAWGVALHRESVISRLAENSSALAHTTRRDSFYAASAPIHSVRDLSTNKPWIPRFECRVSASVFVLSTLSPPSLFVSPTKQLPHLRDGFIVDKVGHRATRDPVPQGRGRLAQKAN